MICNIYDIEKKEEAKEEAIKEVEFIEKNIPFYTKIRYYTLSIDKGYTIMFFYIKVNKVNKDKLEKIFKKARVFEPVKYDIKHDITFIEYYIEYRSTNVFCNDLLLLTKKEEKGLLEEEKKLLEEVRSYNKKYNDKSITYNDLSLLEEEEEKILEEAIRLKVKYPAKIIRFIELNYLKSVQLYINNKSWNNSKKDKAFTNFIKNLLKEKKEAKEKAKKINKYGIYDNYRYEKKDTLKDYDNFNEKNYYNLKDLKFKNFNYKL